MDDEVELFCQKVIIESGLILDEDLIFIRMVEREVRNSSVDVSREIIILATALCTTYYALKKRDVKILAAAAVCSLPTALSLLMSFYHRRKTTNKKKVMIQLLTEFKNLSRIHSELNDFLKRFNYSMNSSNNTFVKISEETIHDLSKYCYDIQAVITKNMQNIISKMHVGLHDVSLDLTGFEKATAVPLNHDTVMECLRNATFIEGQVVLLRSHLLTSMFLVSSSKGESAIFLKVLDESIPQLVNLMKDGGDRIKIKLNETRFPVDPPTLSLAKIENIFVERKIASVPRMRRHVIKINDGICCTLIKLRALLETVEMVESEFQIIFLQEAVATLTQELYGCYLSAADLEKLIQLLNRNLKNIQGDPNIPLEVSKEATSSFGQEIMSEKTELTEDLDYQVFSNIYETDDDNECNAVCFYKRFMKNEVDWLAELKQSDEFQRRQNKFHTGQPKTSTPIVQERKEDYKTVLSLDASTSGMQCRTPPPPPPLPSSFSDDSSEIMVELPPSTVRPDIYTTEESISSPLVLNMPAATPLQPITTLDDSSLLDSLKGVLDMMGRREEDEYE